MEEDPSEDREVQGAEDKGLKDSFLREIQERWSVNQIRNQKCPFCQEESMRVTESVYDLPYFKKVVLFNMKCDSCGFKFNNTYIEDFKEPMRCELVVESSDHLNAMVVRSVAGTVRVPELGAVIEPGPAAQPFITTVEGVLVRIKGMLEMAIRWAETEDKRERGREVLEKLGMVLESKGKVTLVIDDLFGNSAIVHKDTSMRFLKEEEVSELAEKIPVFRAEYAED